MSKLNDEASFHNTHDELGNRNDGRESFGQTIHRAEGSGYTAEKAIAELIDNMFDSDCGATECILDISNISKGCIQISDNGKGFKDLSKCCTLGFQKKRNKSDGGEFGQGFKLASFNIARRIELYTHNQILKYWQKADWDIRDMIRLDQVLPIITNIDEQTFTRKHPFETGSTFDYTNLENALKNIDITVYEKYIRQRYAFKIAKTGFKFTLKDEDKEIVICKDNCYNNVIYHFDVSRCYIETNIIQCYKNRKADCIEFFIKNSNGTLSKYDISKFQMTKLGNVNQQRTYYPKPYNENQLVDYDDIGSFTLTSCLFTSPKMSDEQELLHPKGNVCIIRKEFVILPYDGESYYKHSEGARITYVSHTIKYDEPKLDRIIGTSFNKQIQVKATTPYLDRLLNYLIGRNNNRIKKEEIPHKTQKTPKKNTTKTNQKNITKNRVAQPKTNPTVLGSTKLVAPTKKNRVSPTKTICGNDAVSPASSAFAHMSAPLTSGRLEMNSSKSIPATQENTTSVASNTNPATQEKTKAKKSTNNGQRTPCPKFELLCERLESAIDTLRKDNSKSDTEKCKRLTSALTAIGAMKQ